MYLRKILTSLQNSPKSILLLGPRQTGKSTLIKSLNPDLSINLMRESEFLQFSRNPSELEQRIEAQHPKIVFIDEVQRLPSLLNTIQVILDDKKLGINKFFLTGSSARKLKRGQANLLPGRVLQFYLGPLTFLEINNAFDLNQALAEGTLPGIYSESLQSLRQQILNSYTGIYLREEIQSEALTKNIEGFSRFLYVTAAVSGGYLDLSKLASQAGVPRQTAVRYFEILEDTLIIYRCESFSYTKRYRLLQHPKYYLFDTGILNALMGNYGVSQDRIGNLFEHFFFTQLIHLTSGPEYNIRVSTFRTAAGAEIDFIIEKDDIIWAVEVKASQNVGMNDLHGFDAFKRIFKNRKILPRVAYLGDHAKKISDIPILPWQEVLKEIISL